MRNIFSNSVNAIGALLLLISAVATAATEMPVDKVVAANYLPLMIEGDEDRPGYAVEVMREAARRAGRKIDITFVPFERALSTLQNDKSTHMPALFYGEKRKDLFSWVAEIQQTKMLVATLSRRINSLGAAHSALSIVVERGTTGDTILTSLGFENLVRVSSPEASARMLASGRADAWFLYERGMQQVWQRLGFSRTLTFGDSVHDVQIFLVGSLALPGDVSAAYEDAVRSMKSDGTLDSLWLQYNPN